MKILDQFAVIKWFDVVQGFVITIWLYWAILCKSDFCEKNYLTKFDRAEKAVKVNEVKK